MAIVNKEALSRVLHRRSTVVAASSVASFAAGGGLTYLVLNRRLEAKYVAISEQEIADARRVYDEKLEEALLVNKAGPYADPQTALAALHPENEDAPDPDPEEVAELRSAVQDLGYAPTDVDPTDYTQFSGVKIKDDKVVVKEQKVLTTVETVEVSSNVFDEAEKDMVWDYEVELLQRTTDIPHIITTDEFYNSHTGYDQIQLHYYEGDGVLAEAVDDSVIEDVIKTLGENNLNRIGVASGDPNVLYIRHDKDEVEYEVTRIEGKYGEMVAGFIPGEDGGG